MNQEELRKIFYSQMEAWNIKIQNSPKTRSLRGGLKQTRLQPHKKNFRGSERQFRGNNNEFKNERYSSKGQRNKVSL